MSAMMGLLCACWLCFCGSLSAYGRGPTDAQLAYSQAPGGYDVYVAVPNCGAVGWDGTMQVGPTQYSAYVYDCAGAGGHEWMLANGIAAEVDFYFWMRRPELVGTAVPVVIQVRPPGSETNG